MTRHPDLSRLIEAAKAHKMTPEERDAQRRSFVRGQLGFGSDADEAACRDALAKGDTAALEVLEADAQKRMRMVDALLGPDDKGINKPRASTWGPLLNHYLPGVILVAVVIVMVVLSVWW
jgi:hypothetical protein